MPGLLALIAFSCLNNFLGGAFMALMDAYGLSMMSVQAWGLMWGALSALFIVGGLMVAKTGLGSKPLRLLLLVNVVLWSVTALFPLQASIVMLVIGMAVYMVLVPYAEAAEQTILQRVVPYERQGRVFGFAQSVELAASPLTAFLMGPLTQLFFIPFMTDGLGADLIGDWFGTGPARGIALVFVLTGVLGVLLTVYALNSRYYRQLSARYAESDPPADEDQPRGDLLPDPASDPRSALATAEDLQQPQTARRVLGEPALEPPQQVRHRPDHDQLLGAAELQIGGLDHRRQIGRAPAGPRAARRAGSRAVVRGRSRCRPAAAPDRPPARVPVPR